jgi:hypothetical protein
MPKRSALDNSALPAVLLQASPRRVRVNASGSAMLAIAAALVAGGIWGSIVLSRRAETAERQLALFASERIVAPGEIVRLRRRGGDDDYRITAHYRYMARGRELAGATSLRRSDRDQYVAGSQAAVWYLASEPEASWLDGYAPRPFPEWPGTVVPLACGIAALALIQAVRRQSNLLTYGRPTLATVTHVEKKSTDKGSVWVVHYEWTILSGATRTGKYQHGKKHVPGAGDLIPIVYDRDNSFRHSRYPMSFVSAQS